MNERLYTPKTVARAIGVSESSMKRWCDRGLLEFNKTAGGHRKIPLNSVVRFLKSSKYEIVNAKALDLPRRSESKEAIANATFSLAKSLLDGDESASRQIILRLILSGVRTSNIFDSVVAPAFARIGDLWACGDAHIFEERRACELITGILREIRTIVATNANGPTTLCGSVSGDPYTIAATTCDIVLRESGWNSQFLGPNLPFDTWLLAVHKHQPRMICLSISHLQNEVSFIEGFRQFRRQLPGECGLVVGGRALTESMRQQMEYSAYCDNLSHLIAFANTIYPVQSQR